MRKLEFAGCFGTKECRTEVSSLPPYQPKPLHIIAFIISNPTVLEPRPCGVVLDLHEMLVWLSWDGLLSQSSDMAANDLLLTRRCGHL